MIHQKLRAISGGLAFSFSLSLAAAAPASGQAMPLQPEDVFALEAASDTQISPDGDLVAYVRRSNDIQTDRTLSSVWMIGARGENHVPISSGPGQASSPRWSPDGERLAYVENLDGRVSIRMYWPADGRDAEIAHLTSAPAGLAWSPDGDHLAFAQFLPARGASSAPLPAAPPGADWAAGAQVEERLFYRLDGAGSVPPGGQQLFVLDAQGGSPVQVSHGPAPASGDFTWTGDSQALIFSADRRMDDTLAPDSELYRLDLESGEITQLTDRRGPDTSPMISPDGERLAYLGYDDQRMGYHNNELYVMELESGEIVNPTAFLDRSVNSAAWYMGSNNLLISYDNRGDRLLRQVNMEGDVIGLVHRLGPSVFGRPYTGGDFTVSRDGRIAGTVASDTRPAEVGVGVRRNGFRTLTALNEDLLSRRHISEAEEIIWDSPHDGRRIQGWALYPPNFDPEQKYPLILEIHGGPFTAYGPVFSAELQLMAAAGYVVLYTNPRGSTSYGYEFANLIHHNYPGEDYDDLIGGVDAMIERGFIDEDRLFVTGGSGGGVLTAWIIGNTDRFAASVVAKPVINWASFVLYADLPQFFYRYWFASPPWEDPEEYWRRSPLSLVGEVETPTMLMVGGSDVRTPRPETEQYYAALKLRGVPTRLVVIPDSYHGIANSRPSRLLTKVAEILRWFEEHDPAHAEEGE